MFILATELLTTLSLITIATTPEEIFGKGLMEQSPPTPPLFPDELPQKPNDSSEGQHHIPNEMMLSYISHMLMEDDIGDKLNEHPALLQVQQPFAQVLSSSSSGTNTGSRERSNDFLYEGNVDGSELNSVLSKGRDAVGPFSKATEEANGLLANYTLRREELVNQTVRESSNHSGVKKRHSKDDHLQMEIRTNKTMMVIKEPEENSANEMLDEMKLYGYKECIRDMENLRVTMDNNEVENRNRKSSSKKMRDNNVVDIRRLMISCAQEVAENNHSRARELLKQIMHHASETGDATQRLALCFTKGLEARLVGTGSLCCKMLVVERPSVVEFIKAAVLYYEACCFDRVALTFSEMTIMQAMVGKSKLHIVDYGMQFGHQWAGLLRSLASREGALPEVKITAIGLPKPKSYPTEKIETIGCRLGTCAHEVGLPSFKFHTIKTNWEDVCIEDLNIESDEVLVVNDLFTFSTLMDESLPIHRPSPRDIVLNNISKMRPHVFIQSVYNFSYGSSFLSRFQEMLLYYMALFDMFDATMPRDSKSRMLLEQVVHGHCALNALSCEGTDLVERPERYQQWQKRNQRAGLRQLPLKTSIVEVVKDIVMKHYHRDFQIYLDGQWLLQGWRGRVHFAHSVWVAADGSSTALPLITTPEEFFIKEFPPIFLDIPHKPSVSNEVRHCVPNNDMILPYISNMLMEDDIDNELNDHPALLQVQQPFAQILSSPSLGTNTNNSEGLNDFLLEGHGDESALDSPLSKHTYVVGASLKDLEEDSMLMPKNNNVRDEQLNKDHLLEEEVRTTNKAVMMINELEEKCGNEMLDKIMLHAYETCIKGIEHVTIDNRYLEKHNKQNGRIKVARNNVVNIRKLLISCAQALTADDHVKARELLGQIKQHALATGDTTQRLAHCFAKGLEARILGTGSQLWQFHMLECPSAVEILKAYSLYSEACCFMNVTFIFSAITIMQAMAGKKRLHIVDYGTRFGFYLVGFLRLLASKEGSLPQVKITAIGRPQPICYLDEQIEKIGYRLRNCANELGLPSFKFHTIKKKWEDTSLMDLQTDVDEVLVVIDFYSFSILMEESIFFDARSPRDTVLNNIKEMKPDVFIQNVTNRSYGSSFVSRFREMLLYYMALFDMLDATIERESKSRLVMEKFIFGCRAFNGISCEGMNLVERPEKYRQWQTRNQRAGLMQLPLKSSIVKVVKDDVMKHYHKDFMISEDGQWLLQGWMGRVLFAHTSWVADENASS